MGKGRKKGNAKKRKKSNKKKIKKLKLKRKYKSRAQKLLDLFSPTFLRLRFKDDKKALNQFGRFLVEQQDLIEMDINDELLGDDRLDEKFKKLCKKKVNSINEWIVHLDNLAYLERDIKKLRKKRNKSKILNVDKTIAHFLDPKKYKSKPFNSKKYRKMFKEEAKAEKREYKDMVKLGYIKRNDPDDEYKKLKLNKANKSMISILSDSYSQKHPL